MSHPAIPAFPRPGAGGHAALAVEAVRETGVSRTTIWRLIRAEKIASYRRRAARDVRGTGAAARGPRLSAGQRARVGEGREGLNRPTGGRSAPSPSTKCLAHKFAYVSSGR